MSRHTPHPLLLALLCTTLLSLLALAHALSSNSSPAAPPHPFPVSPSLRAQLWTSLERLIASDIGFALLVLPFSLSALPIAYLLLRKPASLSTSSTQHTSAAVLPSSVTGSPANTASAVRYSSTASPLTAPIPVVHYVPAAATLPHSDFLIVGCGVAGATLSTLLARRGYTVACVERDLSEPHRIVGELLQPGGCQAMEELGLGELLAGFDAQVVRGYTIIMQGEADLVLKYPLMAAGQAGGAGGVREEGRSFHNGRFVQSLRGAAQREPNCRVVEGNVTELLEEDGAVVGAVYHCKTAGGEPQTVQHRAAMTIVADGCLSAFRRQLLSSQQQKLSSFLGLILTDCPLPTASHGHVILAQPTPILAYPISSTEVRMLIDFPNGTLPSDKAALTSHLLAHVQPQLPAGMQASFRAAVQGGRVSSMPNQSLVCRPVDKRGVLLVGDSSNMRHPLTGGGMTVAMFNSRQLLQSLATHAIHDMNDPAALHAAMRHYYTHRTTRAKVINILADALYNVFCSRYDSLRYACFHYLARGEAYSGGPVRLLSGVSQSQLLLVYHFYAVAAYGVAGVLWGGAGLMGCVRMMQDACRIILPLLARENEEDSALVRLGWRGWKRVVGW